MELDKELKEELIELIKQNKPIPSSYKALLFPPEGRQKEYELIYGCKEREEDILRDTMSVPFQPVRQFGDIKENKWHNMLIFSDNLQALKHLLKLKEKGQLRNSDGTNGIRLVYIDPPFGTGEIYDAKGVPAYSAKLQGAEFIEFLRKRLIFLKELLTNNGSIYVRIDYHFGHHIKLILDEVFNKNNFQNEIIVNRVKKSDTRANRFNTATDSVFLYVKTPNFIFNGFRKKLEIKKAERWHSMDSQGQGPPRLIFGKKMYPPKGRHWTFTQEKIDQMIKEDNLRLNPNTGRPEYRLEAVDTQLVDSNWTDIPGYTFQWDYPTENSEQLLKRIITASSNPGDIVLDCFAGSGTTGAVCEKLKDKKGNLASRRWIMVDSSKLAIYTMIKRMFNLKSEISNKGKALKSKPFVLYNAGLYENHDVILKMGKDIYKNFALELFQAEEKDFELNGLKMDGLLFNCPVKVFSQGGYLTEEYVKELHNTVGELLKGRMFIIAPASRVYFLQDYIEKEGIRYYILRIPYSVIDELHEIPFKRPRQPASLKEINQNIDQIGFDFVHPPKVKATYYTEIPKDKLFEEAIIELKEFEAVQRSKEPIEFKDSKDALSMVLIDTDYNGKYFNMTHKFFADEIKKENYKVRIFNPKFGEKIMMLFLDVLGNELVEIKSRRDFKRR